MRTTDEISADTEFWRQQFGESYLFKFEKEGKLGLTKSTIGEVKRLWTIMEVPQRTEWCVEAGIGGCKGSIDVDQMDIDMLEALSQVAIIEDKGEKKVVNKYKVTEADVQGDVQEAVIEEMPSDAQEMAPEANKKDIIKGKEVRERKVKKTKAEKQAELGEAITAKETKPKTEKPEPKAEKKPKETVTKVETVAKVEKPVNVSKAWADATNRARINMCASVGVRKNQFRAAYGELNKEDKAAIVTGDLSILTYRGKAGKGNGKPKAEKVGKAPKSGGGDLVGGGFGIKLKNVRDIGGGAILAKGVDADGQEYVVFMAPKGK